MSSSQQPQPTTSSHATSSLSHTPSSYASTSSGYDSETDSGYDSDEEAALIREEWEESMRQMQALVSIVIIPFVGKWWGRQWSYWAYDRYLKLGLTRKFLGL